MLISSKVFVANPKKSKAVSDILIKNREKLLEFLPKFHAERRGEKTFCKYRLAMTNSVPKTDDEQFIDEKAFLTKQIESLQPQPRMVPA